MTRKEKRIKVIKAMLDDKEFQQGRPFSQEAEYAEKYGFTIDEMVDMEVAISIALSGASLTRISK